VVSLKLRQFAGGKLLKPITDRSPGTDRPNACAASLPQNALSGRLPRTVGIVSKDTVNTLKTDDTA
jgi:hypothetical protein